MILEEQEVFQRDYLVMKSYFDYFQSSQTLAKTHSWLLACHDAQNFPLDDLAKALADRIMRFRCRGCIHLYQAWKKSADGLQPLTAAHSAALKAFISPVFGLPGNPNAIPQDHLEGFVAEHLWYFFHVEAQIGELVVRIEPPGVAPTDPGGDGLIIHRMPDGSLMFRLWEIKKCTGNSPVDKTVSTAYNQLSSNATEYLARYTVIGQELEDKELANFYSQLIDLWITADPGAAIGVSVATSSAQVPDRCFTTFGNRFPQFVNPMRLRGMLTALDDFSDFCLRVRDYVWTGL